MKDGLRRHLREYHERALESGLDTVGRNTDVIARDVARMAAVLDQALPAIMEQLAMSAQRLDDVALMTANPAKTAGAELFRDGSYALASGWVDEAVEELTKAVAKSRFHSTA